MSHSDFEFAKLLSPRRKSTTARTIPELAREQLDHFGVNPDSDLGKTLLKICERLYSTHGDLHRLWELSLKTLARLDRGERISYFNAKRFLCFQMAKLMDTLLHPLRKSYQSLILHPTTHAAKGPYPIFDNVPAIFSANPVITRTATYLYACTEWIDDAFQGKELLLDIYSRLLNPTSVSLANYIVDISAGPYAKDYFAWNFNSGMAAIDTLLSHLVGYEDIILSSRNIYGGTYQLLHDWYAKRSNLNITLEWFDGYSKEEFKKTLNQIMRRHRKRLKRGRQIYIFIESPCNPHGYVLDVAGICQYTHQKGFLILCDATIGTPFLCPILRRREDRERPDFVIHSYTKDLGGTGTVTAGVVIGRNERMFIPKKESVTKEGSDGKPAVFSWNDTLFWNVYYVKGAFLDSEKAFDVITGIRTLEMRMLKKCINTIVLAAVLSHHPYISVHCSALKSNPNHRLAKKQMYIGLPSPLFTIDFEPLKKRTQGVSNSIFKAFYDSLEPAFSLQVSLGQTNTVILCPALTSHSELSSEALKEAGISSTTLRISVGDEDPRVLLAQFIQTSKQTLDKVYPNFSKKFMRPVEIDALYQKIYVSVHRRHVAAQPTMEQALK